RGPLIAARLEGEQLIGQRVGLERLRWTGALLSLTMGGAAIPVTRIELADDATQECELWAEHELPPAIAAAIGHGATAYR
ncbi:MAG TPA: hypothetical protein VG755_29470, partial [Nannocystaceae bacterium]|nr:hypothetical protein [Nannocystaceae bacterium]